MKYVLQRFMERIDGLKRYVNGIILHRRLLSDWANPEDSPPPKLTQYVQYFRDFNSVKARIDYAASIVSLSSLWESYIEELIADYLEILNTSIPDFSKLPVKIKETHTSKSADLLLKLNHHKNAELSQEAIVANMHSCVQPSQSTSYTLNRSAYTHHSANLRVRMVNELFSFLGIPNIFGRVKQSKSFIEYMESVLPEVNLIQSKDSTVFKTIEDLADLRNEAAHGLPENLLDPSEVLRCCETVEQIGKSIQEALTLELLFAICSAYPTDCTTVMAYPRKDVVCLTLNSGLAKTGDLLIAISGNKVVDYGIILELQVDRKSMPVLEAPPQISFGAKVDFKVSKSYSYRLIPREVLSVDRLRCPSPNTSK